MAKYPVKMTDIHRRTVTIKTPKGVGDLTMTRTRDGDVQISDGRRVGSYTDNYSVRGAHPAAHIPVEALEEALALIKKQF